MSFKDQGSEEIKNTKRKFGFTLKCTINKKIIQEKLEDKINCDLYLLQEKMRIHSYLWKKMKLINLIILVLGMLFIREKTTATEMNDKTMVQEINKFALNCFTDSQTPGNVRFSLPGRIVFSGRESPEIFEYLRISVFPYDL